MQPVQMSLLLTVSYPVVWLDHLLLSLYLDIWVFPLCDFCGVLGFFW